jgi:hypothetical protein
LASQAVRENRSRLSRLAPLRPGSLREAALRELAAGPAGFDLTVLGRAIA